MWCSFIQTYVPKTLFLMKGFFIQTSLHGSCPVVKGEKWVATKWIRDQDRW